MVDLILKITMKYLIENESTLKNAVIVCNWKIFYHVKFSSHLHCINKRKILKIIFLIRNGCIWNFSLKILKSYSSASLMKEVVVNAFTLTILCKLNINFSDICIVCINGKTSLLFVMIAKPDMKIYIICTILLYIFENNIPIYRQCASIVKLQILKHI